jgi:hypothetical protein
VGAGEQAEADLRAGAQPYLDALNDLLAQAGLLQAPDYSGIQQGLADIVARFGTEGDPIQQQLGDLATRMQQGPDEAAVLESQARGAGFVDAQGNADVQGYLDYLGQFRPGGVPTLEGTGLTAIQERALASQGEQMRAGATQSVENMLGETGAFMRAMAHADELTSQIADLQLRSSVQMINDNFAARLASYDAQSRQYETLLARGQMSREQVFAERMAQADVEYRTLMGQYETLVQEAQVGIGGLQAQAGLMQQGLQDQISVLETQLTANYQALMAFLGVETAASDAAEDAYNQYIAPYLDQLQLDLLEQELTFGWDDIMDFLGFSAQLAASILLAL